MELSPEQLEQRYKEVPLDIRLALSSNEFAEKIFAIGEENGLLLDQSDALSETVALIMLGVISREDFRNRVSSLGIPDETVTAITAGINEKILNPLKGALQEKAQKQEEDEENLTQESILREIEDPSPARFTTVPKSPLLEAHNAKVLGKEDGVIPEPQKELTAEPLVSLPDPIDPSHELPAPAEKIVENVAPKIEAQPTSATTPVAPPPAPAIPITQSPRTVNEVKPLETEKRRTIDPYREPIE